MCQFVDQGTMRPMSEIFCGWSHCVCILFSALTLELQWGYYHGNGEIFCVKLLR